MMDNVSVVRSFTLTGMNETMDYRGAIFSLSLVYYCVILFLNISLVVLIVWDENLHEPMYVLLCCVCINAVYGTTGFYPKFLLDLLSIAQEISYEWCLFQAFVMYSFACCELSILAVMAYDSILLTSRLELCSLKIQRLLCVNWIIVQLACPGSNTLSNSIVSYATIFIYVSHGFFIIWTYMHLIRTCAASKDDRVKFMQTCVPHLISLITFLTVIVFDLMYMRFGSAGLPQSLQNFIAIEFLVFPPMMNPLIYGFKLTKIRNRVLSLIDLRGR
ncbi:PREDICTED: olfactory receptor 52D1-like isoform X2 [Cyprinodon variegatus]|uniref:olfactory receptor 52D1-like isoform X2 n=1 Tax=Cyprinodon variegatus TaxID=28743 RepID=UPI000742C6B7|nr:PREDICTED: olfactory receptor 52D1-like isoform X2 [Cyprinodon variegatus]